jgi:hypothetical protein
MFLLGLNPHDNSFGVLQILRGVVLVGFKYLQMGGPIFQKIMILISPREHKTFHFMKKYSTVSSLGLTNATPFV